MDRMDRRWDNIPAQEIADLAKDMKPEVYASDWMAKKDTKDFFKGLSGKSFRLVFDSAELCYEFSDSEYLKLRYTDGKQYNCFYRAVKVPGYDELIFVHHYLDGCETPSCLDLLLDLETGYCTVVTAEIGHPKYAREVVHKVLIGEIDGMMHPPGSRRPELSSELVGKAIDWQMPAYTNKPPIKHSYISNKYYAIAMTRPDGSCFISADPADYVKIKDDVFLVSAVEERRSGIQLTFAINTSLLEDVVGHFGISAGNEAGQDKNRIVCTVMTGRKGTWGSLETIF